MNNAEDTKTPKKKKKLLLLSHSQLKIETIKKSEQAEKLAEIGRSICKFKQFFVQKCRKTCIIF